MCLLPSKAIHGYLALCICIIGSLTNICNIIILTRKDMINSTNTILTGLAVVDFLILVEYTGFACSYIFGKKRLLPYYYHAVYVMFHAHFTQVSVYIYKMHFYLQSWKSWKGWAKLAKYRKYKLFKRLFKRNWIFTRFIYSETRFFFLSMRSQRKY